MDDMAMVRDVLNFNCSDLGYKVTETCCGEEAVVEYGKRFKTKDPFYAVILDLTVPGGMGGKEAALEILKIDPDAKIIFGAVNDSRLRKGEIKITVIATGFGGYMTNNYAPKKEVTPKSTGMPEISLKKDDEKEQVKKGWSMSKSTSSFTPPAEKKLDQKHKPFAPEITKITDDGWDVPAFIRRKNKS